MSTRHMFDFPNNDASTPLCHNLLTGGAVVRQVISNVNCPACIELWKRAQQCICDAPHESTACIVHPTCQGDHEVEKLYLVCRGCGEACDTIEIAQEHGASDPNTKSWCGEGGFDIAPESEAF